MPKYSVGFRETHYRTIEVEAANPEEALRLADIHYNRGDVEELLEFSDAENSGHIVNQEDGSYTFFESGVVE